MILLTLQHFAKFTYSVNPLRGAHPAGDRMKLLKSQKNHGAMVIEKRSTEVSSSLSDFQREMRCVA